jgi:hypothetical protein
MQRENIDTIVSKSYEVKVPSAEHITPPLGLFYPVAKAVCKKWVVDSWARSCVSWKRRRKVREAEESKAAGLTDDVRCDW